MSEDDLKNSENWQEFGLVDHFAKFKSWGEIADEAARLLGAEEGSPISDMLLNVAASAADAERECPDCGHVSRRVCPHCQP